MTTCAQAKLFDSHGRRFVFRGESGSGFTLVELLVVLSVISILMAILIPALGKVRQQARRLISQGNMREIVTAANCFADDNRGLYPPSVATIGIGDNWNWQEPTYLTAYSRRIKSVHRSVSAYLHDYISDASTMVCPCAPWKYKYLQEAWDAGDSWNNPDIGAMPSPMVGTYCLYWNYTGYLSEEKGLFQGPRGPARGVREGRILVSDYVGYNHFRSPGSYGSCEQFRDAGVTEGSDVSSSFWSRPGELTCDELTSLDIKPNAGYTDGHVESFSLDDTAPMRVIRWRDTGQPYEDNFPMSPGLFYLPRLGVR